MTALLLTAVFARCTPALEAETDFISEEASAAEERSELSYEESSGSDLEEEFTEEGMEPDLAEGSAETDSDAETEEPAVPEAGEESGSSAAEQPESPDELSDGTEAVPGNTAETVSPEEAVKADEAGSAEDPEKAEQEFVVKVFSDDSAVVTDRNDDGSVLICGSFGVLFAEYEETEAGIRVPASAICWDASLDRWYTVDKEGGRSVLAAGFYSFYGGSMWKIGSGGCGFGGYVVDGDACSYYLGNGDISSGLAGKAGADGFLPEAIYHGARWTESDVVTVKGGYHTYNSGKYYFKKDGTILRNGTMKVGDRYYEFGPDGSCVRSYSINYWKQERLGYYVRVDGNGNIIRTAGFYEFDGNTYYLCGNSGRRVQGWLKLKNGTWYFDEETGVLVTGYQVIDGVPYYFNPEGSSPGKMVLGNIFIDGRRYYFNYRSGQLVTGWITGGADGSHKYYVNNDGSLKRGWSRIASENRTYYFEPTWCYALSGFQTIDGNRYLFVPGTDAVGRNWVTVDGNRYYCDPATAILTTGFATINGKEYYFDASGKLVTNQTNYKINGKFYNIDQWGHYTEVTYTEVQLLARDRLDIIGWTLRNAYDWSVMPYVHIDDTVPSGYTPADYYGLYGLRNHRGDCYVMASTFYQMAIQLGFDAHFVMGYVPLARGGYGPHGWVEIDQDGGTYVYDPDFEYDEGLNGYRIYYGKSGTWRYTNYYRTN